MDDQISKISLKQNSISIKILKIHEIYFYKIRKLFDVIVLRWCIFGPTPIRPTAHPTY